MKTLDILKYTVDKMAMSRFDEAVYSDLLKMCSECDEPCENYDFFGECAEERFDDTISELQMYMEHSLEEMTEEQ